MVVRAVQSVLAQTTGVSQIVVVVDGADPSTERFLSEIDDDRLEVVVRARSEGAAAARNLGIQRARTPLVALLDDDDVWLPSKLERQLAACEAGDDQTVVACQAIWRTATGDHRWPLRSPRPGERIADYLFLRRAPGEGLLATPTLLLPTDLAKQVPMETSGTVHEDLDWLLRLEAAGARVKVVLEPLVLVDGDDGRESLSHRTSWQASLAWTTDHRELLGPRAASGFALTEVARLAAAQGQGWVAAPGILHEALHGRPRPRDLAKYAGVLIAPGPVRHRLRTALNRSTGRQPKVSQVMPHTDPGGMQTVAKQLHDGFLEHGITPTLLHLSETEQPLDGRREFTAAALRLTRMWSIRRPRAVLAHAPLSGGLALGVAWVTRVPVRTLVLHESCAHIPPRSLSVVRGLALLGVATDIVFVGHTLASTYSREASVMRRGRVIRNGVALPRPALSVERQSPPDTLQLLTVGRLVKGKNIETLVKALAVAVTMGSKVHLIVCGDGPERHNLEDLASAEGVVQHVTFLGHVSSDRVATLFVGSDAFLFPSRSEGLPLALLEASVHGLPIIASDLNANREVAEESGVYLDVDDVQGWAGAIVTLGPRDTTAGQAGPERSRAASVEHMISEYVDLVMDAR